MPKTPPLTMKTLAGEIAAIRTATRRSRRAWIGISLGVLLFIGVFVSNQWNEQDRTCQAIDQSFDSFLDVFIPGLTTRRPSLPPRPAEEQAQLDEVIAKFRNDVGVALEACR